MKDRAPLGGLIRDSRGTTSRYERGVITRVFSSLEECITYSVQEELGSSWGIFYDNQGDFRLTGSSDPDALTEFIRWCPPVPVPVPQPLLKWAGWCESCGGVIWAGQLACPDCGWSDAGWED